MAMARKKPELRQEATHSVGRLLEVRMFTEADKASVAKAKYGGRYCKCGQNFIKLRRLPRATLPEKYSTCHRQNYYRALPGSTGGESQRLSISLITKRGRCIQGGLSLFANC